MQLGTRNWELGTSRNEELGINSSAAHLQKSATPRLEAMQC